MSPGGELQKEGAAFPERETPDRALDGGPSVTVIVCTYNRAELLRGCLASLADQSMPADRYEVIVVENACTDDTSSVVERLARENRNVRLVREPKAGKSRAANAGLAEAKGARVAFIDDDGRAPRDWVEKIDAAFEETDPTPAVVLGRVTATFEKAPPSWWKPVMEPNSRARGFLESGWDRHRVCGSNFAFDRSLFVECGGFSVDRGPIGTRFRLGEDTEAVFRVASRHPRIWYDPAIVVEHWVPKEGMTLRHLVWRSHLSGVAISEIENVALCSSRIPALVLRLAGSMASKPAPHQEQTGLEVLLVKLLLRAATVSGMVRGARLLR